MQPPVKPSTGPASMPFIKASSAAFFFSQAVSLLRSGFRFWLSKEEIQELSCHNRQFETPRLEQELVMLYFRKPGENEPGQFVTAARAIQVMGTGITQKLSAVYVGRAFMELGFARARIHSARGYLAVQRTAEEIRLFQLKIAMDAAEDMADHGT